MDQRSDLQGEIYQLEQKLKRMKEELVQLKARKKELEASGLSLSSPIVPSSVSGLSKGASAVPSTPKKGTEEETKRTPWHALTRETGVL